MVLEIKSGNILSSTTPIIAHQVNCRGVMGAGLAKEIKTYYPGSYYEYSEFCAINKYDANQLLGSVLFCKENRDNRIIAHMFGQSNFGTYKTQTDYKALAQCFGAIRAYAESENITNVAFPFLVGCGLAGGDWNMVLSLIFDAFTTSNIIVELYQLVPHNAIFGTSATVTVDHLEDNVVSGDYNGIRFTAPAELFCKCNDGDTLTFSASNDTWFVNSDETAKRAENINNLWTGLNFQ